MTTLLSLLRDAQHEILNLRSAVQHLEPRATAFDLLVRTHLGSSRDGFKIYSVADDLSVAISDLQQQAEAAEEAEKAKETAKKVKAKKPRAPRTPKTPGLPPAEIGGALSANGQNAAEPEPSASPPDNRRRRGLFAVGTEQ